MADNEIFTADEIASAHSTKQEPNLPPAGHARREELARRTDQLEEKMENLPHEVGKINEKAFEVDREIRNEIEKDYLAIGLDHPTLKTRWVNYRSLEGQMVWQAKSQGWRVATLDDFPEARELLKEDNTIRVGDVLLMCISFDRYVLNSQKEEDKRLRQEMGVEQAIRDITDRHSDVFRLYTENEGGIPERIQKRMKSAGAVRTAANHIGNRMKNGPIKGLPIK